MPEPERPPWRADPVFWVAVAVGLTLRALPLLTWGWASDDCTRDECIYKIAARPILTGEGLGLAPKGWLPAPGYPYLLAACHALFGRFEAVKWVQVLLTPVQLAVLHLLGGRVGGRRGARFLALAFAVHPTFIFYVGTLWTETLYTLLLTSTVLALLWAREGGWRRAALPGALLGLTVLFRGVATWLGPLFLLTLASPEALTAGRTAWATAWRARRRHVAAMAAALALTVAPYSVHASLRWGGPVITDATLGHVIALGNDDYPPVTFDYAIGQLTGKQYARTLQRGRRDCPQGAGPLAADGCEVERAVRWIADHPGEFVARIPTRLAQLFNPHSFLTRHVRWNYWPGMPWALKELLVAAQALCTLIVVGGGTWVAFARGRGPWGLLAAGTIAYHVAVITALYGLTRFRLPLEPLWLLFLAAGVGRPGSPTRDLLTGPRARLAAAALTTGALLWLMSIYLWTGWLGILG